MHKSNWIFSPGWTGEHRKFEITQLWFWQMSGQMNAHLDLNPLPSTSRQIKVYRNSVLTLAIILLVTVTGWSCLVFWPLHCAWCTNSDTLHLQDRLELRTKVEKADCYWVGGELNDRKFCQARCSHSQGTPPFGCRNSHWARHNRNSPIMSQTREREITSPVAWPLATDFQLDVSKNSGFSPQIIHFNRVFHDKPSILGYHYFWKHPTDYNYLKN